jgi:hypothetical protein
LDGELTYQQASKEPFAKLIFGGLQVTDAGPQVATARSADSVSRVNVRLSMQSVAFQSCI